MAYELTSYVAEKLLQLTLQGTVSLEEMKLINQRVTDILDESKQKQTLLINVSALTAGYTTVDHLRDTQRYPDHLNLDTIVVVSNNKLNQLIAFLVFSLSRARFVQFDSKEKVQHYLEQKGIAVFPGPKKESSGSVSS